MSLEFFVDFAACAPVCKGWAHIDYYDNEKVIETYYSECEAGFDIVTPARKSSRCLELRTSCAKQQVHQGPWPLITTFAQSSESRRTCRRCPTRNVFPVSPLKLWHVEAVPADPKRYCSGIAHTTITCPLTCTLAYCAAHIGACQHRVGCSNIDASTVLLLLFWLQAGDRGTLRAPHDREIARVPEASVDNQVFRRSKTRSATSGPLPGAA